MRFDPALTREQTLTALTREAVEAWGEGRAAELHSALEATAGAIWTVAQVTLDPIDVEP